jgi:F0F1-type ATP synthase membrane subunit c/vacuolar-type H+-ATPase subunit K
VTPSGREMTTETSPGRLRVLSPLGRRIVDVLLVVIAVLPSVGFAWLYLEASPPPPYSFVDANTYLAAGERLNAGHELYRLVPGDRQILIVQGVSDAPLLSPPPIAAIWRPIAAAGWGYQAWVIACWVAVLGTIAYLVLRVGPPAVVLAVLLSLGIGQQLAVANVAAFFPAILVASWRYRSNPYVGIGIGAMGAIKLAPFVVTGWLIGTRRWRGLAIAVGVAIGLFAIGAIAAGPASYAAYVDVARTVGASPQSLSRVFGISGLSEAVLVAGLILAILLGRYERVSFVIAVVASTIGTPALYFAGLAPLLAVLAPLIRTEARVKRASAEAYSAADMTSAMTDSS